MNSLKSAAGDEEQSSKTPRGTNQMGIKFIHTKIFDNTKKLIMLSGAMGLYHSIFQIS